jgi:N-acetylglucosamine-6-phosphate deacetylase
MRKSIFVKKLFTGTEVLDDQLITCENGSVLSIESSTPQENSIAADYLSAGLIDIHINGGEQFYLSQFPNEESVADINDACYKVGVPYTLPTLITSPLDNILKGIEAVKNYKLKNPRSGVLGMHLEGPFINPVKRGAHLVEFIQQPTNAALDEIIRHGKGVIRMITIAPEVFSPEQIDMLLQSGITVSAGHSDASFRQAAQLFKKGVHLVTHLYNAMSGLQHRSPGLVGATFDNTSVYAPIILDGVHCDFAAARIAYKIKKEKLFMISDALFIGRKVKNFHWGNYIAHLENGHYINSEGNLSGASISLGDAVRNAVNEVGIGLQEAIEMATVRPATALGMDNVIGRVAVGYPSVFTSFDSSLKQFAVVRID